MRPEPIELTVTGRLVEAGADFLYLLERGYDRRVALDLVTGRWSLSRLERLALYRCVFDSATSAARRRKLVRQIPERLAIDGFNVLSTVQAALIGDVLVKATDGFVRDLSATVRKVRVTPILVSALSLTLLYLAKAEPREVLIVFDAQVSKSGELAGAARGLMASLSLNGSALTSRRADACLSSLSSSYVIATSDSVVVDRAPKVMDLGGKIAAIVAGEKVINLGALISAKVAEVAEAIAEGASEADEEDGDKGA